jgi:hypothetical protein
MTDTHGNGRIAGREVLARPTLKTERVKVEEWEATVILRELSAAQTAAMGAMGTEPGAGAPGASMRLAAWVLVAAWVDEAGDPALGVEDIDMLLETQSTDLINRLATRVMVLSGLAPDALADAEKKSESSLSEDSGTP